MQGEITLPESLQLLVRQLLSRTAKAVSTKRMEQSSFCISNAISVDQPLVYASPGFCRLTGYSYSEIVGRNCRFLQGPATDQVEVQRIRTALREGRDITSVLLNYRKDGTVFWNQVKLAHLKDQTGRTFLLVGIQTKLKALSPLLQPETVVQQTKRLPQDVRRVTEELLQQAQSDPEFSLPPLPSDVSVSANDGLIVASAVGRGVFEKLDPIQSRISSDILSDLFPDTEMFCGGQHSDDFTASGSALSADDTD